MSTNVITLSPEQKSLEAYHYLKENKIRRAPVVDDDHLVGIVSESDLYRVLPCHPISEESGVTGTDIPVKDFMTTDVQVLHPNDHLEMAAKMMLQHKIGGLPVLKDGHVEGLITESDIFEATWNILSQKTNHRILFFEKDPNTDNIPNDYIKMCFIRGFVVNTFISYPRPDEGGSMHYLCVQGKDVDELIEDLWAHSCEVIFSEEYSTQLSESGLLEDVRV
jgi:CBS domain-containing protein